MFRGVTDEKYDLKASIGRARGPTDPRRPDSTVRQDFTSDDERALLERFKDQTRPHLSTRLDNDLEWLVFAQHHGLPTRVLDWTRSPLVAAFFATEQIESHIQLTLPEPLAKATVRGEVVVSEVH